MGHDKIRQFEREDLAQVIQINRTSLPENYPPYFFISIHENNPECFLVAEIEKESEKKIVGYCMCRIERGYTLIKKKGHVVSIAVIEEERQKGIGTALMKEAIKIMGDKYNVDEVFLEVRVSNPAVLLYEKLGMKATKTLTSYYRDGEDAFRMELSMKEVEKKI